MKAKLFIASLYLILSLLSIEKAGIREHYIAQNIFIIGAIISFFTAIILYFQIEAKKINL